eukprot:UC4_evm7s1044
MGKQKGKKKPSKRHNPASSSGATAPVKNNKKALGSTLGSLADFHSTPASSSSPDSQTIKLDAFPVGSLGKNSSSGKSLPCGFSHYKSCTKTIEGLLNVIIPEYCYDIEDQIAYPEKKEVRSIVVEGFHDLEENSYHDGKKSNDSRGSSQGTSHVLGLKGGARCTHYYEELRHAARALHEAHNDSSSDVSQPSSPLDTAITIPGTRSRANEEFVIRMLKGLRKSNRLTSVSVAVDRIGKLIRMDDDARMQTAAAMRGQLDKGPEGNSNSDSIANDMASTEILLDDNNSQTNSALRNPDGSYRSKVHAAVESHLPEEIAGRLKLVFKSPFQPGKNLYSPEEFKMHLGSHVRDDIREEVNEIFENRAALNKIAGMTFQNCLNFVSEDQSSEHPDDMPTTSIISRGHAFSRPASSSFIERISATLSETPTNTASDPYKLLTIPQGPYFADRLCVSSKEKSIVLELPSLSSGKKKTENKGGFESEVRRLLGAIDSELRYADSESKSRLSKKSLSSPKSACADEDNEKKNSWNACNHRIAYHNCHFRLSLRELNLPTVIKARIRMRQKKSKDPTGDAFKTLSGDMSVEKALTEVKEFVENARASIFNKIQRIQKDTDQFQKTVLSLKENLQSIQKQLDQIAVFEGKNALQASQQISNRNGRKRPIRSKAQVEREHRSQMEHARSVRAQCAKDQVQLLQQYASAASQIVAKEPLRRALENLVDGWSNLISKVQMVFFSSSRGRDSADSDFVSSSLRADDPKIREILEDSTFEEHFELQSKEVLHHAKMLQHKLDQRDKMLKNMCESARFDPVVEAIKRHMGLALLNKANEERIRLQKERDMKKEVDAQKIEAALLKAESQAKERDAAKSKKKLQKREAQFILRKQDEDEGETVDQKQNPKLKTKERKKIDKCDHLKGKSKKKDKQVADAVVNNKMVSANVSSDTTCAPFKDNDSGMPKIEENEEATLVPSFNQSSMEEVWQEARPKKARKRHGATKPHNDRDTCGSKRSKDRTTTKDNAAVGLLDTGFVTKIKDEGSDIKKQHDKKNEKKEKGRGKDAKKKKKKSGIEKDSDNISIASINSQKILKPFTHLSADFPSLIGESKIVKISSKDALSKEIAKDNSISSRLQIQSTSCSGNYSSKNEHNIEKENNIKSTNQFKLSIQRIEKNVDDKILDEDINSGMASLNFSESGRPEMIDNVSPSFHCAADTINDSNEGNTVSDNVTKKEMTAGLKSALNIMAKDENIPHNTNVPEVKSQVKSRDIKSEAAMIKADNGAKPESTISESDTPINQHALSSPPAPLQPMPGNMRIANINGTASMLRPEAEPFNVGPVPTLFYPHPQFPHPHIAMSPIPPGMIMSGMMGPVGMHGLMQQPHMPHIPSGPLPPFMPAHIIMAPTQGHQIPSHGTLSQGILPPNHPMLNMNAVQMAANVGPPMNVRQNMKNNNGVNTHEEIQDGQRSASTTNDERIHLETPHLSCRDTENIYNLKLDQGSRQTDKIDQSTKLGKAHTSLNSPSMIRKIKPKSDSSVKRSNSAPAEFGDSVKMRVEIETVKTLNSSTENTKSCSIDETTKKKKSNPRNIPPKVSKPRLKPFIEIQKEQEEERNKIYNSSPSLKEIRLLITESFALRFSGIFCTRNTILHLCFISNLVYGVFLGSPFNNNSSSIEMSTTSQSLKSAFRFLFGQKIHKSEATMRAIKFFGHSDALNLAKSGK